MLSLEFCVIIDWRIGILIVLYCKSSRLSVLNELLKLISYHIFQAIFKRSDAAFHVSALWNDVEPFACLKNWKSWGESFRLLFFQLIQVVLYLLIKIYSLPNGDFQFFWFTSVATGSNDFYFNNGDFAHDWTLLTPQLSQRSRWPLVTSINFINTLKASLLYHELSSWQWSLLWRLEKQSDGLVFGYFLNLL